MKKLPQIFAIALMTVAITLMGAAGNLAFSLPANAGKSLDTKTSGIIKKQQHNISGKQCRAKDTGGEIIGNYRWIGILTGGELRQVLHCENKPYIKINCELHSCWTHHSGDIAAPVPTGSMEVKPAGPKKQTFIEGQECTFNGLFGLVEGRYKRSRFGAWKCVGPNGSASCGSGNCTNVELGATLPPHHNSIRGENPALGKNGGQKNSRTLRQNNTQRFYRQ